MRAARQGGFGLVEVMIVVGLLAVIALASSRFLARQFKAQSTLGQLSLLNGARAAISTSFDCRATLGATPGVLLPCTGAAITSFRRRDGTLFSLGTANSPWEFRGRCVSGEFLIEAKAKGSRATAGAIDSRSGLRGDWFDIFEGQSDLCTSFFSSVPNPCTAPGEELVGMAGNVPVCGPKRSLPTCSKGQVITTTAAGTPICTSLQRVFADLEFTVVNNEQCLWDNKVHLLKATCPADFSLMSCAGGAGDLDESNEGERLLIDYPAATCTLQVAMPRCSRDGITKDEWTKQLVSAYCFRSRP